ncbi:MAG: Xaa-Pro peptidase family protein [SAR324 cluster bacterium]|nr:Xaa-Pro peptidase family protein [SAR324 cluster bacterium]
MTADGRSTMGNMSRLREAVEQSEFDAVIAISPENVRYAGDVFISSQVWARDRLALVVWSKGREPVFIQCNEEEGYVRENSWITDIRSYVEFKTSPAYMLAELLEEMNLGRGQIGIETDMLVLRYYRELMERLPNLKLGGCQDLFARVRMLKTPREIEVIAGGFRGTEQALHDTFTSVTIGETEKSLSNRLADAIMRQGADSISINHINAGPNTGYPHATASDYKVKKGDIVKADAGGLYSEYYSNVGRTAKVGKPNEEDQSIWRRLRAIHHEIISMLRPGALGRDLFGKAVQLHEQAGLPFPYAHNGHGIGLNIHERPIISPIEDIPYAPNMLSTVETRVRWPGKVGYHMEDLVLISESGPVVLSDRFDNEEILVI